MQIIIHRLDWYTKIVLTLIAVALLIMIFKPIITSERATASNERRVIDVNLNIDKVGGEKILRWWEGERTEKGIPLYIDGKIITEEVTK